MSTITLELPDDLAQRLEELDSTTVAAVLRQVLNHSRDFQSSKTTAHPPSDFILLPPAPLPPFKPPLSVEQWKERMMTVSVWPDEDIAEIERARDYIDQWQPRSF